MSGRTPILYLGCPPGERHQIEGTLADAGFEVTCADDAAVPHAPTIGDACVLVDLARGAAAVHGARELRAQRPGTIVFAVIDAARPDLATEALLAGAADVFVKPLDGARVRRAADREQAYHASSVTGHALGALPAGDIYGHSPAMQGVLAQVARASAARGDVMVRGDIGTGRRLVAETIHRAGRARGAFVALEPGLDADDVERALFGVRAAAGRDGGRRPERAHPGGALCRANHGTLYVPNVVDLPTRVQGRLVRALRDREVALPHDDLVSLDVRIVAAVDRGVEDALGEGRLRDDLHRRLSAHVIDLPPLRMRRDDIGPLANFFVREICASLRVPPKTLSRPALSLIVALPWRGNALELRLMLRAVVAALPGGRGIGLDDVLSHVSLDAGSAITPTSRTLRQARVSFEREYVAAVLARHGGRVEEAARTLGIQRTNLYRKIRALKVDRLRRR